MINLLFWKNKNHMDNIEENKEDSIKKYTIVEECFKTMKSSNGTCSSVRLTEKGLKVPFLLFDGSDDNYRITNVLIPNEILKEIVNKFLNELLSESKSDNNSFTKDSIAVLTKDEMEKHIKDATDAIDGIGTYEIYNKNNEDALL